MILRRIAKRGAGRDREGAPSLSVYRHSRGGRVPPYQKALNLRRRCKAPEDLVAYAQRLKGRRASLPKRTPFEVRSALLAYLSRCSMLFQQHCRPDLLEGALPRGLVGTKAQELGAVAEAAARDMVVTHLDHELRLHRLPFAGALDAAPAARPARRLPVNLAARSALRASWSKRGARHC